MLSLAEFTGCWSLSREIADRLGGSGRFDGAAVFSPSPDGLLYEEEGSLTLARGGAFAAQRSYDWRDEGGTVAVHFADGAFFHRFALSERPEAAHFCAPDQYDVAYDFSAWPDWTSRWTVRGPRKDYEMTSRYRRAD
ncbi:DUF6314 family protein [Dinoroseobacter sp. PD6]|uniref:DUF6314 family protein n=1 Tax=Dinoroseobacter sp. PD6 TaxID=3028384 RepID=UPI00237AF94F|nr:DUF6314 family protein [Dinoroseobacter sp. PD6]MDD9715316.1 DUF6314 family protein [Dinoroseobacter sp. PD6]